MGSLTGVATSLNDFSSSFTESASPLTELDSMLGEPDFANNEMAILERSEIENLLNQTVGGNVQYCNDPYVTRGNIRCPSTCTKAYGKSYHWCSVSGGYDYCSISAHYTVCGNVCGDRCERRAGYKYYWCSIAGSSQWGYCSPRCY